MVKGRSTNEVERGAKESSAGTYKKGLWTSEEDNVLLEYVKVHGKGKWNRIPTLTGLKRCGKSCRLRWMNYLSPSVKKGDFSQEEDDLIIRLHKLLGNRWALIAGRVPGRTDNQVKNYWNTHLSKKLGVKARKCKSIQTLSHPQQDFKDKTIHSNVTPFMKHSESRGPIEEHKCLDYVTDMSFEEFPSKEEGSLTEEKHNSQGSLVLSAGDDDLIVNNQSLLDFLSEYSLDYVWSNSL